jgi:hypothetical protein
MDNDPLYVPANPSQSDVSCRPAFNIQILHESLVRRASWLPIGEYGGTVEPRRRKIRGRCHTWRHLEIGGGPV